MHNQSLQLTLNFSVGRLGVSLRREAKVVKRAT